MSQRTIPARARYAVGAVMFVTVMLMAGCAGTQPAGAGDVTALVATVEAQQAEIAQLREQVGQLSIQVNANTSVLTRLSGEADAPAADLPAEADAAAVAAAAATPTPAPPQPLPTPEPLPMPTPFPPFEPGPLTGEPPAGMARPDGALADRWAEDVAVQEALGWAVDPTPRAIDVVMQPFERGLMIWRSDNETISVFINDGAGNQTWAQYPDTFREGEPEFDPTLDAPGDAQQPVRGFGKLWRGQPELREQIGWATGKEAPYQGKVQEFQRGQYLSASIERIIAGHAPDGTPIWSR